MKNEITVARLEGKQGDDDKDKKSDRRVDDDFLVQNNEREDNSNVTKDRHVNVKTTMSLRHLSGRQEGCQRLRSKRERMR
jgi:hypothetical protein